MKCVRLHAKHRLHQIAGALALASSCMIIAPGTAHATLKGTCTTGTAISFAVTKTSHPAVTTSTEYVLVPGTDIDFVQGGLSPSCVVVVLSAEVGATFGSSMVVAAEIDARKSLERETAFSPTYRGGHPEATFIFPDVPPGTHKLKMKFKSSVGESVQFNGRTTVVYYAP